MSAELEIIYNAAAANLYVVLRRPSDAKVWNGTAWATWADGNIATYAIVLTDKGGDLYQGDFPTAATAGLYRITYYLQAGASPATTDTALETAQEQWNGVALVDTSVVTLSPYALTTVVKVKRFLHTSATVDDDLLTELINAWTARMERIAGRQFAARAYTERYCGNGTLTLELNHYPVNSITSIVFVAGAGSQETITTIDATTWRYDSTSGIIRLIADTWIDELGNFAAGFRNYEIVYNGGYATVPDDLDMLCRELVAETYNQSKRDTSIRSESLGDYSYTLVDSIVLTESQRERLRAYSNPPLGAHV